MIDFPVADLFDDSYALSGLSGICTQPALCAPRAGAPAIATFARRATTTPIAVVSATTTLRCSVAPPLKAVASDRPRWGNGSKRT